MKENIIRTICIKLDVDGHEAILQATQERFNEAASWIASVCWEENITNTNTAHHRVYGETRKQFGLGSQLAICARAKAVEAIHTVKSNKSKTCPQFGARGSVRYDMRSFSLKSLDRVSLLTLEGRLTCRLLLGKRQHDMLVDPTWQIGSADLVWKRGTYYLHLTQHQDKPPETETPETLGVDLGIVNLATDSDGESFSGEAIEKTRKRYHALRQRLQKRGTTT